VKQYDPLQEILRSGEIPNFTEGKAGRKNSESFTRQLSKLELPELMTLMDVLISKMEEY